MVLNKAVYRKLSNAFALKRFEDCPMFFIYKTKSLCFG